MTFWISLLIYTLIVKNCSIRSNLAEAHIHIIVYVDFIIRKRFKSRTLSSDLYCTSPTVYYYQKDKSKRASSAPHDSNSQYQFINKNNRNFISFNLIFTNNSLQKYFSAYRTQLIANNQVVRIRIRIY